MLVATPGYSSILPDLIEVNETHFEYDIIYILLTNFPVKSEC